MNSKTANETGMVSIQELLTNRLRRIEERRDRNSNFKGCKTGFLAIDERLGGLQNGELCIIAARPSIGKTAFAENIVSYAAITCNVPVVFFSMEMSKESILERMITSLGIIDANRLRACELRDTETAKLQEVIEELKTAKLYIDDTPNLKASEIKEKCQSIKSGKIGLIVVDQLTEMWRPMEKNHELEYEENARAMKRLAVEMDCPVILLQQLKGGADHRQDKRPILADLKETGATDAIADTVILLYRDAHYNPETDKKNIAEVIVAKSRNTDADLLFELVWLRNFRRFANLERF